MKTLYEQLHKAFRADEHEWNNKKHIYVNVNATIQRLNELKDVAADPIGWSFESKHFSHSVNSKQTSTSKDQYNAFCVGELTIPDLGTRMGTGADTNADLDTASKSAQAYALRKAANQFGVAMYLLRNPGEEDELVKHLVNNDPDDSDAMKEGVIKLMAIRGIEVSAANLVDTFGVSLDNVKNDSEIFRKILQKENRI